MASATRPRARSRASSRAPVAAIRSHTSPACSGPASAPELELGQLGVAVAGEYQRERHGALEQVRPARLARALDRPRHVEDVVEQLEGQADASREGHRARPRARRERPSARERAQAAGGLEQRGRLQLAAAQVALDRHLERVAVLALEQLADRQRRARVRERPQLLVVAVAGQLRERPREQQVAGRDRRSRGRRRRRPSGSPAVAPRRRSGRRGRASPSGRARPRRRLAPGRSRRIRSEVRRRPWPRARPASGRRRLPPAAIVALACAASGAPAPAVTHSRCSSIAPMRPRRSAPPLRMIAATASMSPLGPLRTLTGCS